MTGADIYEIARVYYDQMHRLHVSVDETERIARHLLGLNSDPAQFIKALKAEVTKQEQIRA